MCRLVPLSKEPLNHLNIHLSGIGDSAEQPVAAKIMTRNQEQHWTDRALKGIVQVIMPDSRTNRHKHHNPWATINYHDTQTTTKLFT